MVVLLNEIHGLVMEEEEGSMEAGDHQVLIVPRVGNEGAPVRAAGQSSKRPPNSTLNLVRGPGFTRSYSS